MVFMAKVHQFFQHLALFSQNPINTNKIEMGDNTFDIKNVSTVVRLASKFFNKMQEHVEDNSIPKDVSAFAKSFFTDTMGGGFVLHQQVTKQKKQPPFNKQVVTVKGSVSQTAKSSKGRKSLEKSSLIRALRWASFMSRRGLLPLKHCLTRGC